MQPQTVPHALRVAHTDLVREIENSLAQFKQGGTYSNPALRGRIEAFVDALYQIPGAQEELVRRANLVDSRCQPGTEFDRARSDAVAALKRLKSKEKRVEQLLASLGNSGCPLFLDDVAHLRRQIERILKIGALNTSDSKKLIEWRSACQNLQQAAEPLQADGCRCLHVVHVAAGYWPLPDDHQETSSSASQSGSSENWQVAALLMSGAGAVYLEQIGLAADSLLEWACGAHLKPATSQSNCESTAIRTKRSTRKGEGREKLIAALTRHHSYAKGGALNYEPIGNNELARLADVDPSTASDFFKQNFGGLGPYKKCCGDSSTLIAALKLLNDEFSPKLLLGIRDSLIEADSD